MTTRLAGRDMVGPIAWLPTGGGAGTAAWRTQRPELDLQKCTGCMVCWRYCPEPAIAPSGGKVQILLQACKGCGVCAHECPVDAIAMVEEGR